MAGTDPSLDRRQFLGAAGAAAVAAGAAAFGGVAAAQAQGSAGLEICYMDAVDLAAKLRAKELSAVEVMTAFLDRIEATNPAVNAIVSMVPREQAMAMAAEADADLAAGKPPGKLHGMPWAVKDMEDVIGIASTQGSPIFKDNVPQKDSLIAGRIRAAGALIIGKTNVPELGAGANTINPLFGPTRNPHDLRLSAAGSTGGGAAALASGMLPITDGSDTGGSCRAPGSWNNVVGFRTSLGRVPIDFPVGFFLRLPTYGPMARTVRDAGYLLSVMAGPDPLDPVSLPDDPEVFAGPLDRDFNGVRIAWSPDLGYLPVEQEVIDTTAKALPILESIGCVVEPADPQGLPDVYETSRIMRGTMFAFSTSPFFDARNAEIREAIKWEVAGGRSFSALDIGRAEAGRSAIYQSFRRLLDAHAFLVLPVTQVVPFPVEIEYPTEINGQKMRSYLEWMEICYTISLTGLPAISVPCGFTASGMPLGLQIVGRRGDDLGVLQLAHAFEKAAGVGRSPVPAL